MSAAAYRIASYKQLAVENEQYRNILRIVARLIISGEYQQSLESGK